MKEYRITDHGSRRSLFGWPIQQSYASLFVIEKLLFLEKPKHIFELGCATGTLALYLYQYCLLNNSALNSYDIEYPKIPECLYKYFFHKDDLKDNKVLDRISSSANDSPKALVIIDAWDPKSQLVNMLVPKLTTGIIVLAHDYIINENKSFRWGFRDKDILVWSKLDKFEPYYSISKKYDTRMLYTKVK